MKGEFLGDFEFLVLLALLRLGKDAYGVTVRRELEERAGRSAPIGAVYATLDRLETKGYVTSAVGEPLPERGGRARKYFQITGAGKSAVHQTQQALARMSDGLDFDWSQA